MRLARACLAAGFKFGKNSSCKIFKREHQSCRRVDAISRNGRHGLCILCGKWSQSNSSGHAVVAMTAVVCIKASDSFREKRCGTNSIVKYASCLF